MVIFLGVAFGSYAQGPLPILIPNYINYQGQLVRNTPRGPVPVTGTYQMTFRIYNEGGDPLWEETHEAVEVKVGIFNVVLGEVEDLTLRFEEDYLLGMEVDGDGEMVPRQKIVSTGYSFMSQDSYTLNGFASGENNGLNADMVDGVHYAAISKEIDDKIKDHKNDWGHLTNAQRADLTDGGDTDLHYHAINECSSGSSIRQINSDGSVVCEPDTDTDTHLSKATVQQWANEVDDVGGIRNVTTVENYACWRGGTHTLTAQCPGGYKLLSCSGGPGDQAEGSEYWYNRPDISNQRCIGYFKEPMCFGDGHSYQRVIAVCAQF